MLYFDIETIPTARAMAVPYPAPGRQPPLVPPAVTPFSMLTPALMAVRQPPENMSHADTLIQWRLEDEKEWEEARRKESSLSPRLGRVLCLGYAHDEGEVVVPYAYTESQEREVLRAFWAAVREAEGQICGFNSRSFDVPFLLCRSAIQDVLPSVPPAIIQDWLRKNQRSNYHLDLREGLTGGQQFAKGKLDDWSKFLGGKGKLEGMSGAKVYPYFLEGRHEEIIAYQIPDVTETRFVAQKLAPYFSLPKPDLSPLRVRPAEPVVAAATVSPFDQIHTLLQAQPQTQLAAG